MGTHVELGSGKCPLLLVFGYSYTELQVGPWGSTKALLRGHKLGLRLA